jgi:4'-phosphopantetheinyl transferase
MEKYILTRFTLKPDTIHFFYTQIDEIKSKALLNKYHSIINKKEKEKINRYIFEKDQHNCLVTRALIRFLLSSCTNLHPEEFKFSENRYGKPDLIPGLLNIPVKFNLSHSGGVTACALTLGSDIGLDIENSQRQIDFKIADRFFSTPEANYLNSCPEKEKQNVFYNFWTLKESYIKARGKGLSIGLDKFSFKLDKQKIRVHFHESLNDTPAQWQFFQFSPCESFKAAISIKSPLKTPTKLHIHKCIPFN